MEITGKLLRIEKLEQITEKFKKKRLIIEYSKNEKYPQILEFTLTQNNVALADVLNQGDEVKLLFDFKGREFADKNSITRVFNTLDVWRIDVVKKSIDFIETPSDNSGTVYNDTEDLPF
jgi:translation initiation factor IF-3